MASDLQGIYRKQDTLRIPETIQLGVREPMLYEQIFIGPSSIPFWGDCYENIGDSYILGLKWVSISIDLSTAYL